MRKLPLYLFLAASLVNIIGAFNENASLSNYSKPLLMPLLALFFITQWQGEKDKIFIFSLAALFLSWAGDVLLLLPDEMFFLFGLGAFLLAHISYMITYYQAQTNMDVKQNKTFVTVRIIILAMVGGAILNVLWPHLDGMRMPVAVYTAVIILMAVFAVLRKDRTSPASFSYIYGGALFFIASDGMIAVTKFIEPFAHYRMFIMLTYLVAQFLIIKGILAHRQVMQ